MSRAEEIQARLDEKRKEREAEKPLVETTAEVEQQYTCSRCGEDFAMTTGGGLHIAVEPTAMMLCPACYIAERSKPIVHEPPPPKRCSPEEVVAALLAIGVNVRKHGHLKIEDLSPEAQGAAEAFVTLVGAAGRYGEVSGLYVFGPVGTGKSQLAVSIIRRFLYMGILRERDIVYDRARSMITELQDRYTTGRVHEFSEARYRAGLWVYEDAGTEKHTPDAFRVMEDIFDHRDGHPTIVTSNLNRPDLVKVWDQHGADRFRSRLAPFKTLLVGGLDRRFQP